MIKTSIGHLILNIDLKNLGFYKALMDFLGWTVMYDAPNMLGVEIEQGTSLWFARCDEAANNDYDGVGMNHLAFAAKSQADVDKTVAYLNELGIPALFNTPCHRPEFSLSPDETYYQVMFETPDRILFEVVYIGPRTG